jgi:hypothetical protein
LLRTRQRYLDVLAMPDTTLRFKLGMLCPATRLRLMSPAAR